jgi:hypothetical protein
LFKIRLSDEDFLIFPESGNFVVIWLIPEEVVGVLSEVEGVVVEYEGPIV